MDQTQAPPTRNHQLDGLRGYAALAVVVYHSILACDSTQIRRILLPSIQNIEGWYGQFSKIVLAIFNGDSAVVIFFVMSGAVLFASLNRESGDRKSLVAIFAIRRVLRIYPALIVYLFAALAIYPIFGVPASFEKLLINLSLTDFPLNGASWTLSVEMMAAPYIFVCCLVYRQYREWGLFAVAFGTMLILKANLFAGHLEHLKMFLFCFALGMLVPTRVGEFIGTRLPGWFWIVAIPLMLFAKHIVLFGGAKTAANIQQISAALLVAMLYYGNGGRLRDFLCRPVSAFLGRISYSLYLFNVLFLETITAITGTYRWTYLHPIEAGFPIAIVIVALTIPTAYLVTRWVEEPAIAWGRRLTAMLRKAPAPLDAVPAGSSAAT